MKFIGAMALAFAATFAYANGGGAEPPPPEKPNHECQGNSCNGAGLVNVETLAKNWNTFSNQQKVEITLNLPPAERQRLMDTINENKNTVTNSSPSTASSSLTGNTTTTTIGGTTYTYDQPVAGAFVQLPSQIVPGTDVKMIVTACGPDFTVEEVRKTQATSNVGMGLFTSTRDNGVVMKTIPGTAGLVYAEWKLTGRIGEQLIEERTVNGYQAIIYAYLAGSSASSGININGQNGAGAIAGAGGVQTFGKEIDKLPCSYKETRKLTPMKTVNSDDLAAEIAAKLALRQTLSSPTFERKWVPCPKEGCKAPKGGYYTYERKDGSIEASTELTGTGKSKAKSETKDGAKSEKGAFVTGPEIRRLAEEAVARKN